MIKFLILGGGSQLSQCFHNIYNNQSVILSKQECDITSKKSIKKALEKYPAKYVVNCAAITDVELCEKDPNLCFNINTTAVYLLNQICLSYKRKLIQISSDYAVEPINTYGWSKYLTEKIINHDFLCIRTNFYSLNTYIVKKLLNQEVINSYINVYFNPISINRLTKEIYQNIDKSGLLNLFTKNKISYIDFSKKFCTVFNFDQKKLIKPALFENVASKTFRPLNSYIKSDLKVNIMDDLLEFKQYIKYEIH